MELAGIISEEEAAALAQIRKAKQERTDPKVAAEAAIERLARQHQHVMGGKTSFAKAYAATLETKDGRQLYDVAAGRVAISDPEALVASIHKIAARP